MADIIERYLEQLLTTAETLRRRFVSYYDGIFIIAQRIVKASERAQEILEPASYDLRDYVNTALAQTTPISTLDKDWRNTLVETYLGISVLMTGLSYGHLAGAYSLTTIMDMIFDRYVEVGLLIIIPIYVYLTIHKSTAMDDMERRSCLFGLALSLGILAGHLWPSTINMAPAVHFIPPLIFALLVDNEILTTPLAKVDRLQFFAFGSAIVTTVSLLAGVIPLGYISSSVLLSVAAHSAFFILHFQFICQTEKDKSFSAGESQFFYVLTVFFLQLFFSALFGVDPYTQNIPMSQATSGQSPTMI